jgi:hypothetical protein
MTQRKKETELVTTEDSCVIDGLETNEEEEPLTEY